MNDSLKQTNRQLSRQLSDNERRYQLVKEIANQSEKITSNSDKTIEILNKLVYNIAKLDDEELDRLNTKLSELRKEQKKLRIRYDMLKAIERNECGLNVDLLKVAKTGKQFTIDGKKVNIETIADEVDYEIEYNSNEDTDVEDSVESFRSDVSYDTNGLQSRPRSPRKRIFPERFESFPENSKTKRRLTNGSQSFNYMVLNMVFGFLLYLITFYASFTTLNSNEDNDKV